MRLRRELHRLKPAFVVRPASDADLPRWLALRDALWPGDSDAEHIADIRASQATGKFGAWLALAPDGAAVGFLEATQRDFADGAPVGATVGYLEGVFVTPGWRRQGVGTALVGAMRDWARSHGATWIASDAVLDNAASHAWHAAMGFAEVDRVVVYVRRLDLSG